MNMNEHELIKQVVGAAYEVANDLGCGFLEKVYERALLKELNLRGLAVKIQAPFSIFYKGHVVGEYFADLLVEETLVVELKCTDGFSDQHLAQCINYLRVSGLQAALLINFQRSKVEWRRVHPRSLTANLAV
jgi:GxxExxY protein